jgi:cardiolipin synthase
MVHDIRSARHRVWVECYIFLDDAAGKLTAQALKERARAGVDVRVLYDAIGSQATSAAFFDEMHNAGVQVHAYRTLWDTIRRNSFSFMRRMNRRNHRKLTVIDDIVAYFGGMNIVDQSQMSTPEIRETKPTSAGWRDIHVRTTGPQVPEIADSFNRSWNRACRLRVKRRPRKQDSDLSSLGDNAIRFFDSGFRLRRSPAATIFRQLIRRAQKRVLLSMAYFLPTGRIMTELSRAPRRGVRIDAIIPAESDVKLVQWATCHLYSKLLRHGINVFERQERMLHSKVMVVDDQWTVIGSCNLDPRSLWTNLEFLAVIRSPAVAAKITELCEQELQYSNEVTLQTSSKRSMYQRLRDRLAYSLRWWL